MNQNYMLVYLQKRHELQLGIHNLSDRAQRLRIKIKFLAKVWSCLLKQILSPNSQIRKLTKSQIDENFRNKSS